MLYLKYAYVVDILEKVLLGVGCESSRARHLAEVFATNSLEGYYSHGINRFPRFVGNIKDGSVKIEAEPERISGLGGLEVWDGHLGAGISNADICMDRAIELSLANGIGCVALRNTNHWMRGGRYGWQAAEKGVIGICWTNTVANMPAWGTVEPNIGNNPIVLAVPREKGHVVMDMAMSQFAYGKLEIAALNNEMLPIDGGFNTAGELTRDPREIIESRRMLPIGYWKGSAMSLLLDLIVTGVSLGKTSAMIGHNPAEEKGLSQIFIAINYRALVDGQKAESIFDRCIDDLLSSTPANKESEIRYPGQKVKKNAGKNLKNGIPVNEETWEKINAFLK